MEKLACTSVTRTVREPELFSGELSRTFGSGSVRNVGRTPAHHISMLELDFKEVFLKLLLPDLIARL